MRESLFQLLADDLRSALDHNGRVIGEAHPGLLRRINVCLTPGMISLLIHRLAHAAWQMRCFRCAAWLSGLNMLLQRVDIHPACSFAGGVYIPHPAGVLLQCHAGRNLAVFSGASVAALPSDAHDRWARLGDNVWIGARARVSGPVQVGDHARIGPGAVLQTDIDKATIAFAPRIGEAR